MSEARFESEAPLRDGNVTALLPRKQGKHIVRARTQRAKIRKLTDELNHVRALLREERERRWNAEVLIRSLETQMDSRDRVLRDLVRSASWRATAPLRRAEEVKAEVPMALKVAAFKTYVRAPLPRAVKEWVRHLFFRFAGRLFASTNQYRRWILERHVARTRARHALPAHSSREPEQDYSIAVPLNCAGAIEPPNLAVICHIFHADLAHEFRRYLGNIPFDFRLFITTDTEEKRQHIARVFAGWPRLTIRTVQNRGRDIAPKLLAHREVYDSAEYVLHLHTKMSPHAPALAAWRGFLLENLLGSPEIVRSVFTVFRQRKDVGMIAAQHFEPVRHAIDWGDNFAAARRLARRMNIAFTADQALDFASGSMFWARSAALRPLLDLDLATQDFEPELGQLDGTLAHAIERMSFHICERAGYRWVKVAHPPLFAQTPAIVPVDGAEALDRFVDHCAIPLGATDAPPPRSMELAPLTAPQELLARLQARALGQTLRVSSSLSVAIGIAAPPHRAAPGRILASARAALSYAGVSENSCIYLAYEGERDRALLESFGRSLVVLPPQQRAGHAALMAEAFGRGADVYVAADAGGTFHPSAVRALLQTLSAHEHRAIVEAVQFPGHDRGAYDPLTFETPALSSACIAVPRAVYEDIGALPECLDDHEQQAAFAGRARMRGYALRTCAPALFLMPFLKQKQPSAGIHAEAVPTNPEPSPAREPAPPLRVIVRRPLAEPQPRISVG